MGKTANSPGSYAGDARLDQQSSQQVTGQQTQANRANQSTPWASNQWSQGPDGTWQQSVGFNGGLGTAANGLMQQAGNLSHPMDWSQFGQVGTGDAARDQAINAAYGQSVSRLNPMFQQQQEQLGSQLANQGLDPNSQAYRQAQRQFSQQRNDAYQGALNSAISQGTAAQQATFGENMQARQQAIAEALRQRSMPMDELQGLQGFLSMPGYNMAGRADPTNYLGAAMAQGNWNMQNAAQQNAMYGSLGQAGGAAVGAMAGMFMSDERVKDNVERLPMEASPGVPLATFEYKHEPGQRYLGVIAQDVERANPGEVVTGPDGIKRVGPRYQPIPFGFGGNNGR